MDIPISQVIFDLHQLQVNEESYMRAVVMVLAGEVRTRIHVDGKKASGAPIGKYSSSYLILRSGNYANAEKYTKGSKKGQNKNSGTYTDRTIRLDKNTGVFTGEDKVGKARTNYNRGSDPKVILSLTRQMEQDFVPVAENGTYGLGFNNPHNFDKATWNEARYKGVYELSEDEIKIVEETITEYINGLFG
jgi:hypothetical protein